MGSPFMQDSPSDLSDATDNPDAPNGPIANSHAANVHVAPRASNSPWRHLEDPATGLPANGDIIEWFNLLAYADSSGSSPENGDQSASISSQELDNTLSNSSHSANNEDVQWDTFVDFSSPAGAGNTPPHAVEARYRYDSVQSNIAASVNPREGDSDARAIMIDAAQRDLLAGNFDFLDSLDDAEWRDFMATVDWPELDDALAGGNLLANDNTPADGNAQTNGNTASNDRSPMTNGNLSTDGNVLASGDNLLQDGDALAESNLSAEWDRLLADYDALETPHLTGFDSLLGGGNVPENGDDAVANGDHVMKNDIFAENQYFSANNNPLGGGTRPVDEANTMVNGDHLTTDDNGPANPYLPETDNFLGGDSPGNGKVAVSHGDNLTANANGPTNLINGVHLQKTDENVSPSGILENSHVPACDHDATDGFFSPMNTPGSTNGTNDNSRVNDSPPAVSPHRATSPHPAESPSPAGNRHPAFRPLSAGGPSSTEKLDSDDNPQSADIPYQGDTSEAAAQGRIEQLCREAPFPTPTYAESQKCIIRPYHIQDATALQYHANNPLITRHFSYSFTHPYTYNDARSWILNQPRVITPFTEAATPRPTVHSDGSVEVPWGNTLNFVIASCQQNERNALLSGIGVKPGFNTWNRSAELSFWIAEPYWGRGIATSAVGIFLRALFSRTLGLGRVTAYTLRRKTDAGLQGNFPAGKVLWRNKFKREGCLRKSVFKSGEWWDQEVWGVLREDVMREPNMTGAASGGPVR